MVEAKVRLSFMVPGAIMLSSQECDKNPENSYDLNKVTVEGITKRGYKDKETITVTTRKSVPAVQSIIIGVDAYKDMIDSKIVPTKSNKFQWIKMNDKQRLEFHINEIVEALGGYDPTYQILDD